MKKLAAVFILAFSLLSGLIAETYSLDSRKDLDLSGIRKIRFELDTPGGLLSLSSVKQSYVISGGKAGNLSLSLGGSVSTSDKSALADLYSDKSGDTLTVRLYRKGAFYLFLSQSGTARLNASIPTDYDGSVEIAVSSGDTKMSCLSALSLDVKSSSGTIEGDSIICKESLTVKASSGKITLDNAVATKAFISSSSGNIALGEIACKDSLLIHASSGWITARSLASDEFSVTASSGSVSLDTLVAGKSTIKNSSGNVTIGSLTGGINCDVSSGNVSINAVWLDGDIDLENSSGNIVLSLPAHSAFTANLETSSGKIVNEFKLAGDAADKDSRKSAGDANGGGTKIRMRISSGDIIIKESPALPRPTA
jgi:DUF4097 and DUF4098 domain-containing protein YvlB